MDPMRGSSAKSLEQEEDEAQPRDVGVPLIPIHC